MSGIVYRALDMVNGKSYIGQTWNTLDVRKQQHENVKRKKSHPFYDSIKKHGVSSLIWSVLKEIRKVSLYEQKV